MRRDDVEVGKMCVEACRKAIATTTEQVLTGLPRRSATSARRPPVAAHRAAAAPCMALSAPIPPAARHEI